MSTAVKAAPIPILNEQYTAAVALLEDRVEVIAPRDVVLSIRVFESLLEARTKLPGPPSLVELLQFGNVDKADRTDDLGRSLASQPRAYDGQDKLKASLPAHFDVDALVSSFHIPSSFVQSRAKTSTESVPAPVQHKFRWSRRDGLTLEEIVSRLW